MALSLGLHGLAILPLFLIGASGIASSDEPAFMVELSVAAPHAGRASEAASSEPAPDTPPPPIRSTAETSKEVAETPPEPPSPAADHAALDPSSEAPPEAAPEPEIKVELPPPEEPPPLEIADLEPAPTPKPPPKAATARPNAQAAITRAPTPDAGDASSTQQASAPSAPLVVFEGRPRYRTPPIPAVYPRRAIELGQQGEALVRVRLDPDGTAAEILLWRGSGFPLLDRAALKAVRGWHFLPATRDGRPVAAWVEIPVRFHLH